MAANIIAAHAPRTALRWAHLEQVASTLRHHGLRLLAVQVHLLDQNCLPHLCTNSMRSVGCAGHSMHSSSTA